MDSIRSWYNRNAKLPLVGLIVSIVAIQTLYAAFVVIDNETKYRDAMENIIRVVGIALMQKNRIMLESMLYSVSENSNFKSFALCENGRPILSLPVGETNCGSRLNNILTRTDRYEVPGYSDYEIIALVPRLKLSSGYLMVLSLTVGLSILSVLLITWISRRFEHEVLNPILTDFETYDDGKIKEFLHLKERRKKVIELEKEKVVASLARQVAHDIRSPASALRILAQKKSSVLNSEESSMLLQVATRIIGIADDLLLKSNDTYGRGTLSVSDLIQATEKVAEEKQLLYPGIAIEVTSSSVSSSLKVKISRQEWCRMVSNLLQNSVEACVRNGDNVSLKFDAHDSGHLVFSCQDSGVGMTSEVLRRVTASGGSYGKTRGNGLGIDHMKSLIKAVCGDWKIDSKEGQGTTVTLQVPSFEDLTA